MIATNMAGRGVDIKLGGDPEQSAIHELKKKGITPGDESYEEALAEKVAELEPLLRGRGRGGPRARRPLHLRHRAPRVAPHRQPAARPLRPPGRPRRDALLPLRRRRRDPPLRRRPHLQDPRPARPGRRRGRGDAARSGHADQDRRERPEEGRGAELPDPQTRARVRRRDERAAPHRLQIPPRDPRGPRHVGDRPRRDGGRDRAPRRRVHAGRRARGLGPGRDGDAAAPDLAGQRRGRLAGAGDGRPREAQGRSSTTTR